MTQRSQWPGSQALFYLLVLKHHGATEGERDNIKEAKPDTDSHAPTPMDFPPIKFLDTTIRSRQGEENGAGFSSHYTKQDAELRCAATEIESRIL